MKQKPILLIAADLQDLATKYGKSFINNLEILFDARTHTICDETDCLLELASKSSAILYFDKFPADYKYVCKVAASQWNAPTVIGIEEKDGKIQVWHGLHPMGWKDPKHILSAIEAGIRAEAKDIPRTTTVAIAGAFILAVAILLHLTLDAHSQPQQIQQQENIEIIYDTSLSIGTRPGS